MSYDISKIIYVNEEPIGADNIASFVIDTNNWKQPQTDEEIVKITTFIEPVSPKVPAIVIL